MSSFVKDLQHVINCHSRENDSDTPDFILAGLIEDLLAAFAKATRERDRWYNFKPWSGNNEISGGSGPDPVDPCSNQIGTVND